MCRAFGMPNQFALPTPRQADLFGCGERTIPLPPARNVAEPDDRVLGPTSSAIPRTGLVAVVGLEPTTYGL